MLGLRPGIPVFRLIRTAYDLDGRAVEVCDTVMAPRRVRAQLRIARAARSPEEPRAVEGARVMPGGRLRGKGPRPRGQAVLYFPGEGYVGCASGSTRADDRDVLDAHRRAGTGRCCGGRAVAYAVRVAAADGGYPGPGRTRDPRPPARRLRRLVSRWMLW